MAKDKYHEQVKDALVNDGWTITHDPFKIKVGKRTAFIDLGAERDNVIAAEKGIEKIAIEIKSFLGHSDLSEFEDALGQFLIYYVALEEYEPERILYLGVPFTYYHRFFKDPFFIKLAKRFDVRFIIYDEINATIVEWKK